LALYLKDQVSIKPILRQNLQHLAKLIRRFIHRDVAAYRL
jgi:hypothetical protein